MDRKPFSSEALFRESARDFLPDLDAHKALAPLLEHYAIDEILEALRDHCIRMDGGQCTPWYLIAEGIGSTLNDL